MPGTKRSGNRGGNRGRPIQRRYTLSAPAAILLRELTRSITGEQRQPKQEQLTAVLEAAITAAAERRLLEIE